MRSTNKPVRNDSNGPMLFTDLYKKNEYTKNVKGFKTMYEGRFFEKTVNGFASCGYNIHFKILKSSEFGVPQIRERVFIFGTKSDKNFQFPKSSIGGVGKLKSFENVSKKN